MNSGPGGVSIVARTVHFEADAMARIRTRRFTRCIAIGAAVLGGAAALIGIFAHRRDWMADEFETAKRETPPQ